MNEKMGVFPFRPASNSRFGSRVETGTSSRFGPDSAWQYLIHWRAEMGIKRFGFFLKLFIKLVQE
jgi:hypothetical protein